MSAFMPLLVDKRTSATSPVEPALESCPKRTPPLRCNGLTPETAGRACAAGLEAGHATRRSSNLMMISATIAERRRWLVPVRAEDQTRRGLVRVNLDFDNVHATRCLFEVTRQSSDGRRQIR